MFTQVIRFFRCYWLVLSTSLMGLLLTPLVYASDSKFKTEISSVIDKYIGLNGDGTIVLIQAIMGIISMLMIIAFYAFIIDLIFSNYRASKKILRSKK